MEIPQLSHGQQEAIATVLARTVDLVARSQGWRISCLTCCHFNEATETCLTYQVRPPARVLAFGCPSWQREPF